MSFAREQAFGDAAPVRQLEQVARRRLAAPVVEAARLPVASVSITERPGQPAGHAQHEIARHAFGGGEREDAVRIGIVAERGREGGVDAGAREIDRRVEGVAAAADGEAAVAAAREFDHHLADATTRASARSWPPSRGSRSTGTVTA